QVALSRPGLGADDLRQERLGGGVAMEDTVLAALLVVDDELHGEARIAGPARMRRPAAIADHVPGIGRRHRQQSPSPPCKGGEARGGGPCRRLAVSQTSLTSTYNVRA